LRIVQIVMMDDAFALIFLGDSYTQKHLLSKKKARKKRKQQVCRKFPRKRLKNYTLLSKRARKRRKSKKTKEKDAIERLFVLPLTLFIISV